MSPHQGKILEILETVTRDMAPPMVVMLNEEYGKNPFLVLISCLLSLRAKDVVTYPICRELFSRAQTPYKILEIPLLELESLLYSIGFYRKKALLIHQVSQELIIRFNGLVPNSEEKLLSIKGIGRKTAALVLAEGFNIPAICVDTHVHRLANHWGFVKTNTPYETEIALKRLLPIDYWSKINRFFVVWGQNVCKSKASFGEVKCPCMKFISKSLFENSDKLCTIN